MFLECKHEPEKVFNFQGQLDLEEKFLQTAQDLGLYAIVRPSPLSVQSGSLVVYQLGS